MIAALLLAAGCGGGDRVRGYSYDSALAPEEALAVADCLGEWERASDRLDLEPPLYGAVDLPHGSAFDASRDFMRLPKSDAANVVYAWESTSEEARVGDELYGRGMWSAMNAYGSVAVLVDRTREIDDEPGGPAFRAVLLHELGHVRGIGHAGGRVMSADWPIEPCIDETALAALCSIRECGPAAAPTCGDSVCEQTKR